MKGLGGDVLGGHEGDVVRTLSGESGKNNFVAERMGVSQRHSKGQTNQRGGGRHDQEDLGCQSCDEVMRTVFAIRREQNKGLTFREYQEFAVRCEGQVGGHRCPWNVRKYGPQNQKVAALSRRQCGYLQSRHFELALRRVGPPEEPRVRVCVSLWVTLA